MVIFHSDVNVYQRVTPKTFRRLIQILRPSCHCEQNSEEILQHQKGLVCAGPDIFGRSLNTSFPGFILALEDWRLDVSVGSKPNILPSLAHFHVKIAGTSQRDPPEKDLMGWFKHLLTACQGTIESWFESKTETINSEIRPTIPLL